MAPTAHSGMIHTKRRTRVDPWAAGERVSSTGRTRMFSTCVCACGWLRLLWHFPCPCYPGLTGASAHSRCAFWIQVTSQCVCLGRVWGAEEALTRALHSGPPVSCITWAWWQRSLPTATVTVPAALWLLLSLRLPFVLSLLYSPLSCHHQQSRQL